MQWCQAIVFHCFNVGTVVQENLQNMHQSDIDEVAIRRLQELSYLYYVRMIIERGTMQWCFFIVVYRIDICPLLEKDLHE